MDWYKKGVNWHLEADVLAVHLQNFETSVRQDGFGLFTLVLLTWILVHVLLKKKLAHRLIGKRPTARDIWREIGFSASTVLVLSAMVVAMQAMVESGHAEIYPQPLGHGLAWLVISFPLMLLWQDFFFYCTHRLLHTRWMFKHVHFVHHRSRNPSPWAAYAFHPIEALMTGMTLLVAIAAVPLNEAVLTAFLVHGVVRSALGHAAFETMPAGFVRHPILRLLTTTTHHHLHHETGRGNYGLWFTWWDQWCGTERKDYSSRFDESTREPKAFG